ncbi:MAG TPA: TetR/AcrR family transcriptional regulator, partial [Phenylobacterium sp.]|nr:TetR/AcrR family transcriptional regulator [Phenylobacterium sp.]
SPQEGVELRFSAAAKALRELITEQVQLGVERGELSQEAEVKLRGDMLFDAYLANYPEAIFLGWSLEALQARSKDQIRVILAGARRG